MSRIAVIHCLVFVLVASVALVGCVSFPELPPACELQRWIQYESRVVQFGYVRDRILNYCRFPYVLETAMANRCDAFQSVSSIVARDDTLAPEILRQWCLRCFADTTCINPWHGFDASEKVLVSVNITNEKNKVRDRVLLDHEKWDRLGTEIKSFCQIDYGRYERLVYSEYAVSVKTIDVIHPACEELFFGYPPRVITSGMSGCLVKLWARIAGEHGWTFDPWHDTSNHIHLLLNHPRFHQAMQGRDGFLWTKCVFE